MTDPIVEEIRIIRDEYARRFDYNLDEIVRHLQDEEKKSGRTVVNFEPQRIDPMPEQPA
jgi:hypothetical protein